MTDSATGDRSKLVGFLPALLLAAMATLLVLSSLHKKLSYDEFDNLAYGHRFLVRGPATPPLGQRMPVLVLNALGCASYGCRQEDVNASEARLVLVRAGTILFTLLLGLLVYRWAKELWGNAGGLVALVLYVTNPTFLAHGKQVTSDVQTAFFVTAAFYSLWRLARAWRWSTFLLCAAATAGALASKFTGLLILPVMAALVALQAVRARARPGASARAIGRAALFALVVLLALNAVYFFKGSFRRADGMPWQSRAFQGLGKLPLPIPLPRVFAEGLDYSSYLQEHPEVARGQNYVLGQRNRDGRWYAFPLMLLLKTPLAFFVLLALALRLCPGDPQTWAILLVPPAAILAFFSLLVDPQLGIRYVLPALPFLVVAAGAGAGASRGAVAVLLGWHVASTLSYHPHYMAYFNELVGSRVNAYRYLADSNLDWEDHSYFVARWQARHPERRVVVDPPAPRAGDILVGANQLVGIFDEERYRWLRENFTPVGHVAYSHLLFQVSPERLREVLGGGGRAPVPAATPVP